MPESPAPGAPVLPPHAQLVQMAMAHWVSHIVYVAAKLGLADHLAEGPKTRRASSREPTGTHAPSLYRLMRTLASLGILTEDATHRFALTPLGEALKTGRRGPRAVDDPHPGERLVGERRSGSSCYSVQTGKSGFEKHLGMPIFDWLAQHPDEASMFSETMVGFHGARAAGGRRGLRLLRPQDHRRRGRRRRATC